MLGQRRRDLGQQLICPDVELIPVPSKVQPAAAGLCPRYVQADGPKALTSDPIARICGVAPRPLIRPAPGAVDVLSPLGSSIHPPTRGPIHRGRFRSNQSEHVEGMRA